MNDRFLDCLWNYNDRYLMKFTKDDSEINLDNDEADVEFAEWKWANPEEVVEQVF